MQDHTPSKKANILYKTRAILLDHSSILLYISLLIFTFLIYSISFSMSHFIKQTNSDTLEVELKPQIATSINKIYVRSGDTLSRILYKQRIDPTEVQSILKSIKKLNTKLILHIGQKIYLEYDILEENREEKPLFRKMRINIDETHFLDVTRNIDNRFISEYIEVPLVKKLVRSSATIKNSFTKAALSLGISRSNINELVRTYSHKIDFQKQIHKGDKIELILEKYDSEDGAFSHYGNVLFASLKLSGKEHNIYHYSYNGSKNMQYFLEDGRSARATLLRAPVLSARISSRFGKRRHPILGYTRMHKGVDFAAPRGTKIMAAGDGIITSIGTLGAYGKFIEVKHNANLSTAYAHASRYAKGLKRGSRVKQGQTIAFIGSTGAATGPHLHYEVRINGKQVNPLSIKSTPGIKLSGDKLEAFKSYKQKIHDIHKDLYTKPEISMVKDNLMDL